MFRTRLLSLVICLLLPAFAAPAAPTQSRDDNPLAATLQAVVRVTAKVPADARSARTLGAERDGSGVVMATGWC
jgi:hypothetical protein